MESPAMLEELLSLPSKELVQYFKELKGDIMFLGVSGKIGPTLAKMAVRACKEAGVKKRFYGAAILDLTRKKDRLKRWG